MAARLLSAGHPVAVWNRTAAAAEAPALAEARRAASPREAVADAAMVISMVYDDAASRRVWCDATDGAALGIADGVVAIECSTLSPAWVVELAQGLSARGARLLDAPVAGSRPQAEAGQLVMMVGGDEAAVATARPVLAHLTAAVHHVGRTGQGAWLKLAVNSLLATQVLALAEQLAMLRAAGLDLDRAATALRGMPVTSPSTAGALALMLAGNHRPQAPVALIHKDLSCAIAAGAAAGAVAPQLLHAVRDRLAAAIVGGFGAEHLTAVAKLYA
jgi:3-hydroxyisobutyrate dehydrogenase-like beta-hydroxyacid dehydrogenase